MAICKLQMRYTVYYITSQAVCKVFFLILSRIDRDNACRCRLLSVRLNIRGRAFRHVCRVCLLFNLYHRRSPVPDRDDLMISGDFLSALKLYVCPGLHLSGKSQIIQNVGRNI